MQFDLDLRRSFSKYRASALALIGANVLPLLGVIFLGWDAFAIVALYWSENVVIGAINVVKMIVCSPAISAVNKSEAADAVKAAKLGHHAIKFFLVPFFAVHYGFFCFVHGVFVFALFLDDAKDFSAFGPFGPLGSIFGIFTEQHLWWAVAVLAGSHLYSFFVNYLGHGEYRQTNVIFLMFAPYARVVVLHIAILFGAMLAVALGSNLGVLAILIAGKTLLDLVLHLFERERNAGKRKTKRDAILPQFPSA